MLARWNKLPIELRFMVALLVLVCVELAILRMLFKGPDFSEMVSKECDAYGDMSKVNTKTIGVSCYVEAAPGKWITRKVFESAQAKNFYRGFGD